jgi:hypothetical protein
VVDAVRVEQAPDQVRQRRGGRIRLGQSTAAPVAAGDDAMSGHQRFDLLVVARRAAAGQLGGHPRRPVIGMLEVDPVDLGQDLGVAPRTHRRLLTVLCRTRRNTPTPTRPSPHTRA